MAPLPQPTYVDSADAKALASPAGFNPIPYSYTVNGTAIKDDVFSKSCQDDIMTSPQRFQQFVYEGKIPHYMPDGVTAYSKEYEAIMQERDKYAKYLKVDVKSRQAI